MTSRQLRVSKEFERRIRHLYNKLNEKYPRHKITMVDITTCINLSDSEIEMRIINNSKRRRNRYVY